PDNATLPANFTVDYNCGLDTNGSTISGSVQVVSGGAAQTVTRSEERRVGKESRGRRTADPGKNKSTSRHNTDSNATITPEGATFVIAEDGMRSREVSGVQTCAVPIYPDNATLPANFTVDYNCGLDTNGSTISGSVQVVSGGAAQTVT